MCFFGPIRSDFKWKLWLVRPHEPSFTLVYPKFKKCRLQKKLTLRAKITRKEPRYIKVDLTNRFSIEKWSLDMFVTTETRLFWEGREVPEKVRKSGNFADQK